MTVEAHLMSLEVNDLEANHLSAQPFSIFLLEFSPKRFNYLPINVASYYNADTRVDSNGLHQILSVLTSIT
jgi:hypothetical protein